jgi:hypothetical protein
MEALTMDGLATDQTVHDNHLPVSDEEWNTLMKEERGDHSLPCVPPLITTPTPPKCHSHSWNNLLLPSRSVLCRLLRVQSLGDVDFERLYDAYYALVGRFRDGSMPYDTMRWTHPHTGTADWLLSQEKTTDQTMDDVRLVQRYRISSTTRDCSIMIAFQRLDSSSAKKKYVFTTSFSHDLPPYYSHFICIKQKNKKILFRFTQSDECCCGSASFA